MINPSLSEFLMEVNGKRDFNPLEKGDLSGIQMVKKIKAFEMGCTTMKEGKI
jgi:hypothetical protein